MYSLTCDGVSATPVTGKCGKSYLDKESDGLATVEEAVVVGESEVHHLVTSVFDLSVFIAGVIPGGFRPCR